MNSTYKGISFQNLGKRILSSFVAGTVFLSSVFVPIMPVNATVIDGAENILLGANSNYVNLALSGAYAVDFSLSGTLDTGNTLLIVGMDGSGKTTTGSYVSPAGGESSGSLLLDFSGVGWQEGPIFYSGTVYSGGTETAVVASGMILTGVLDTTAPSVVLSTTSPSTITGAVSIDITVSEDTADLTIADISASSGVVSNFVVQSATGYTVIVTPSDSTGSMMVSVGAAAFSDVALNPNTASNSLIFSIGGAVDTESPILAITSHFDNDIVTGFPVLSGTVTDTGGVASVIVNGLTATLDAGTWSSTVFDLAPGLNTVDVLATDLAGNTGATSVILDRRPIPLNTNVELSGTTDATITFQTDITATGMVLYGTDIGLLDQTLTGTTTGTGHQFTLTGLLSDTIYYFLVQGEGGTQSAIMNFKTPVVVDSATASGDIVATGSIYLSGSTATGVTFVQSGTITLLSLTSNGSSLFVPLDGLSIIASGSVDWDGVLQAPEVTSNAVPISVPGHSILGTAYQIGNAHTELVFSGQLVTISVLLDVGLSGQTIKILRSIDQGLTYTEVGTCVVTAGGDCVFTTNQLSYFAFAAPADVIPDAFSFTGVTGAELSTLHVSSPITITGIGGQTAISVVGGEYSIDSAAFTSATGTVELGDTIVVRVLSSAVNSTSVTATLTVGGVSAPYIVTTKAAVISGGGGGGGGGGGSSTSVDFCPNGDLSPSTIDGRCTIALPNVVIPPFTGSFVIPPVILNILDVRFRDIENNWAKADIIRLVTRGIVDNVLAYQPDASLTRAEFLKIVINSTGWDLPTTGLDIPFNDVSLTVWYAPYVSLARSKGMIQSSTRFRPNDPISRAEATKILTIVLGVTVNEPTTMTFVDVSRTSDLAKYIEATVFLNIFSGQVRNSQRIFRPSDPITRAEIAKVVVNTFGLE